MPESGQPWQRYSRCRYAQHDSCQGILLCSATKYNILRQSFSHSLTWIKYFCTCILSLSLLKGAVDRNSCFIVKQLLKHYDKPHTWNYTNNREEKHSTNLLFKQLHLYSLVLLTKCLGQRRNTASIVVSNPHSLATVSANNKSNFLNV